MKDAPTLYRRTAAWILAVCLFLPIASGCAAHSRPLLRYQERIGSVTLTEGGRVWEVVPIPGGFAVTLTAAGITYRLTDTGTAVSAGDLTIPVTDAMTAVPRMAAALFSLTEDGCLDVRTDGNGGITARFLSAEGEITVRFGEGGLPLSFETPTGIFTVTECRLTAQ